MFEMVGVAERATVVFSLQGYYESLSMLEGKRVTVAGVKGINVSAEKKRVHELIRRYTNGFVYVADELFDREKMYVEGVEKQPAFVTLLAELSGLVNRAYILYDGESDPGISVKSHVDYDLTKRMREIISTLVPGGV